MERGNGTMIIYSSTFPFIFSFIYEKKREIFASTSSFFLSLPPRNVIITTLEDTRWIKLWPTAALFFPSSLHLSFFFCFFFFSSFDRLVFSEWKLSRTTWIFTRTIQAYNPGVRRGPVRVYFPGLSGEELTINTTVGGYKGKLMFRT